MDADDWTRGGSLGLEEGLTWDHRTSIVGVDSESYILCLLPSLPGRSVSCVRGGCRSGDTPEARGYLVNLDDQSLEQAPQPSSAAGCHVAASTTRGAVAL